MGNLAVCSDNYNCRGNIIGVSFCYITFPTESVAMVARAVNSTSRVVLPLLDPGLARG